MKTLILLLCIPLVGCAFNRPHLRETIVRSGIGTNEVITTTRDMWLTGYAIWPATQQMEKQKATLGKTFSVGTTGLDQEGGGTNMVEALRTIDSILGKIHP
jgi:hypothetical protein